MKKILSDFRQFEFSHRRNGVLVDDAAALLVQSAFKVDKGENFICSVCGNDNAQHIDFPPTADTANRPGRQATPR